MTHQDWQAEIKAALDEAGRHKDAARLFKRLTRHHEQSLTDQGKALASTQTALALALFAGGERAAGCKAGLEAQRGRRSTRKRKVR